MLASTYRAISFAAVAVLFGEGCLASELVVGGSGLGIGAVRLLATAFVADHPGRSVVAPSSIGSGGGINAVAAGAFGLAVSARPLLESERNRGLIAEPWVRTPFVLAAATGIAARVDMSTDDVIAAYSGHEIRWPNGVRIRPVLRPLREVATQILVARFPRLESLISRALQARGTLVALSDREALEMAEQVPGVLISTSLLAVRSEHKSLSPVSLNGVAPSIDTMQSGLYPMAATLWLVRRAAAPSEARAFEEFLRSPAAGVILQFNGAVLSSE